MKQNDFGQKTITGFIFLKNDVEMKNRNNDGLSPFDRKWDDNYKISVKKGTKVNYEGLETRTGFYHTVWIKIDGKVFYCTKIEKNHICTTQK